MQTPELTIGIVTYNGQSTISAVLDSAIRESDGKNVEILVSDNASTDGTGKIAEDYASRFPMNVRCVHNERNVGFDANVDRVVHQAKGRFVWLMADDDFLLPGSIDHVLTVIRSHPDLALIFVNFHNPIHLELTEDIYCKNGNQFFFTDRFKNGLVSSNVVNRQLWMDLDMSRFDGCQWIHFAYSVQALAPKEGREGFVISDELIDQSCGGVRWGKGGTFILTGLKLVSLFTDMEQLGYDRKVKRMGDHIIMDGYLQNIPWAKFQGLQIDDDLLQQMKRSYHEYPSFWLIDLPMLLVPNRVYHMLFTLAYKLKGKQMNGSAPVTAD